MPTTNKRTARSTQTTKNKRGRPATSSGRSTGGRTRTTAKKKSGDGGKKRTAQQQWGTPPRNVLRNKEGKPMRYGNPYGGGWRLQKTGTG